MIAPKFFKMLSSVLLLTLMTASACSSASSTPKPATNTPESKPQVVLTIAGSGTVTAVLGVLQPAFEIDVSTIRCKILSGTGTSAGVKGVLDHTLDIVAMARTLKDEEAAKGLRYASLGNASAAVVIHPDLIIPGLTKAQVGAIFLGKIVNWSEVGGPDQKIVVYVRDEDESATQVLRKAIFGDTPFPDTTAKVLTSIKDMLAAVSGTKYSIGFASWPGVVAAKAPVKPVAIDGVLPKEATYPYVVPLGIGYLDSRQADVQPFIDWLTSEHGRTALRMLDVLIGQ
jgi:phosphate transport system substrate-binding protein